MPSILKTSLLNTLGFSTLVSVVLACNVGGMEGSANRKNIDPQTSNAVPDEPYRSDPGSPVETPKTTAPTNPVMQTTLDPTETVTPPSVVTGAFLFCFKDRVEGAKATVLCAVEDKITKKPIKLKEKYVAHQFNSVAPPALKVSYRALPIVALWHAEYTITGQNAEIVTAGLASVNFTFEGTDINDFRETMDVKIVDQKRPDLTIRSLKPQTAAEFRCMDLFRLKGDKVVTTPCGAVTSAQDWYITADNKIAHTSGVCIKFNEVSKLTIEGDCLANDTPRFEFAGEQIKILNTNTCVGLIIPDNSGVDYVGTKACNTGDITQHWSISKTILP